MEDIRSAVDLALFIDLFDAHAADIIAHLNEEDAGTAATLLAHLPLERAIDTFDRPELARAGNLPLDQPTERPMYCASCAARIAALYSGASIR